MCLLHFLHQARFMIPDDKNEKCFCWRAMTRKSPRNRIHGVLLWIISHRSWGSAGATISQLVGDLPLWKIRVKWDYCSQYLKQNSSHVPNHQPNKPMIWIHMAIWPWHSIHSSITGSPFHPFLSSIGCSPASMAKLDNFAKTSVAEPGQLEASWGPIWDPWGWNLMESDA